MYACGYVPVALIHRYEKRREAKYACFVQCLLRMAIGEFEDSFYDYAKKWFESVNHGGAFEVSDSAFVCVEKRIRCALATHLNSSSDYKRLALLELATILFSVMLPACLQSCCGLRRCVVAALSV